ncbi:hypothetical protein BU16DRAFT_559065 [Lophium mytilinum]|uniref:Uncharacterized protein n=1 Tax=Lophium mytilinum TaxID=390894 RepID=A0A6A6QY02_9PEZI|nr:hypothetical protein BU16DRAFT_559065 [Lophium mytilinum]
MAPPSGVIPGANTSNAQAGDQSNPYQNWFRSIVNQGNCRSFAGTMHMYVETFNHNSIHLPQMNGVDDEMRSRPRTREPPSRSQRTPTSAPPSRENSPASQAVSTAPLRSYFRRRETRIRIMIVLILIVLIVMLVVVLVPVMMTSRVATPMSEASKTPMSSGSASLHTTSPKSFQNSGHTDLGSSTVTLESSVGWVSSVSATATTAPELGSSRQTTSLPGLGSSRQTNSP